MKKRQHYFDILKAFFVRHSSEYKTSDSDRKVNRNIYPDAVTRDRMRLIDPKSGQLESIHHCWLVEEYIFRLTFWSLSDVLYSDECRTKKAFSMSK